MGGNLVTINDEQENQWVYDTFSLFGGTDRGLQIDLADQFNEGDFVWVSGEPVTYTSWTPGEPSNSPDEDYVHFLHPGPSRR